MTLAAMTLQHRIKTHFTVREALLGGGELLAYAVQLTIDCLGLPGSLLSRSQGYLPSKTKADNQ